MIPQLSKFGGGKAVCRGNDPPPPPRALRSIPNNWLSISAILVPFLSIKSFDSVVSKGTHCAEGQGGGTEPIIVDTNSPLGLPADCSTNTVLHCRTTKSKGTRFGCRADVGCGVVLGQRGLGHWLNSNGIAQRTRSTRDTNSDDTVLAISENAQNIQNCRIAELQK